MSGAADRNLLFGILAMQMDFVTRDQLVAGMQAWMNAKNRPLGEILVEHSALSDTRRALLEPLVEEHVRQHGGDAQKSLAAVSSIRSVRHDLHKIADAELEASLVHVSEARQAEAQGDISTLDQSIATGSGSLRFRKQREAGRGGIGIVHVARDEELKREVALKELQEEKADNPADRVRFVLEAEITGGLQHPGIVPVYGLGNYPDGRPFYAMRFIRGDSLKDAIEDFHKATTSPRPSGGAGLGLRGQVESDRNLRFRKLLSRFLDVCNAMQYAHDKGVLHRDLKPGNIMLGKYGETLVVDWGYAKALGKPDTAPRSLHDEAPLDPAHLSGSGQTLAGDVFGTPEFMSPEQAEGRLDLLGPTSDVYSLGATLFCLLTGRPPLLRKEVKNLGELLAKVRKGEIAAPRAVRADVPAALEAVCLKALALEPKDRYPSPKALAEDIEHWLADEPVSAWPEPWTVKTRRWMGRHRTLVTGAAAALLVGVVSLTVALAFLGEANRTIRQREAQTREANEKLDKARDAAVALALKEGKARALAVGLAQKEEEARGRAESLARQEADTRKQAEELAAREKAAREKTEESLATANYWRALSEWKLGNLQVALDSLLAIPTAHRHFEWHWAWRRIQGCELTFWGHSNGVASVAFSPDGRRIASGSWDRTVMIWDAGEGTFHAALTGHTGSVASVAFSPDGRRIASASSDKTVKVWNAAGGQALATLTGHEGSVTSVAFSPDGRRIISASADKAVKVWDAAGGPALATLTGHESSVTSVACSPDGRRIISASEDNTMKVWDLAGGPALATRTGHTGSVTSVAFNPDGRRFASASLDGTVKVWDAAGGPALATLTGHMDLVTSVAFSPDGRRIVSGGSDCSVKVWDAAGRPPLATLTRNTSPVWSVAFSPDGRRIASGSVEGPVKIRDAAGGRILSTLTGSTGKVKSIAFSPDGRHIALGSDDDTVGVWDAAEGTPVATLTGHSKAVESVAFSPDGRKIASASADGTVKLWDPAGGPALATLFGNMGLVKIVAFSPDGRRIASASGDTVKIWDTAKIARGFPLIHAPLTDLVGHTSAVLSIAFSPDGKRLASGSMDRTVKVWDLASGTLHASLIGHTHTVWSVAFSPDGRRLLSAGGDQTVRVWDPTGGPPKATLIGHTRAVLGVAFSPDGRRLLSASEDQTVKVWDPAGNPPLAALTGHAGYVESVAFSPDGRLLVSGGDDYLVNVWDAPMGTLLATLTGHRFFVTEVGFSPDGKKILSRSGDDTIAWSTATLAKVPDTGGIVSPNPLSPDGRRLAVPLNRTVWLVSLEPPGPEERRWNRARAALDPFWHDEEATRFEKEKDWYAAAFHLGRLAEARSPDHDRHRTWERFSKACEGIEDKQTLQRLTARLWHGPEADPRHWQEIAWIHLAMKDEPAFRARCAQLHQHFGRPEQRQALFQAGAAFAKGPGACSIVASCAMARTAAEKDMPGNADVVAYTACLVPENGMDAKDLVRLARAAAAADQKNADFKETLGAALYRAGEYEEAAATLAAAFTDGKATNWTRLFLAMALKQQGKDAGAKAQLAEVQPPNEKTRWDQRLIHDRLRAEADALWDNKKGAEK